MPEKKIQLVIEAYNKSKAAFDDLDKSIKGIGDTTAKTSQASTGYLAKMKENWMVLSAAAVAAYMAINRAMEYIDQGARAKQVESSFKIMAESSGAMSDDMIANMKKATRETVDDSDLMQKAIKLMVMGYDPAQIERFSKVVVTASEVAGQTVGETYETLSDAIATKMPRALVKMGAVTREQMKIVNEAVAAGADEMSLYELAMANLERKQLMLKGTQDEATIAVQRFQAQTKETKEEIGKGLIYIIQRLYAEFQYLAAGTLGLAGSTAYLASMYAKYRAIVYSTLGDEKKAAENTKFANDAMQFSKDAWASRNELMEKAADNMMGVAAVEAKATQQELAGADAKVAAQMKKMASYKAAEKARLDADAALKKWESDKIGYETTIAGEGLDNIDKKLMEIEAKTKKALAEADKLPKGKQAEAKGLITAAGEVEERQVVSDWYKNYLDEQVKASDTARRQADETEKSIQQGLRETTEETKKELDRRKAMREGEIESYLSDLDLAEKMGMSHRDTLEARIRFGQEKLSGQETDLGGMSKQADPAAWYAQTEAISRTRGELAQYRQELEEATGTMAEGFTRGTDDWLNKTRTAFEQGQEMATTTADAMHQSFGSILFDSWTNDLKSWEDYFNSFTRIILGAWSDMIGEMVEEWLILQTRTALFGAAGGGGGGGGLIGGLMSLVTGAGSGAAASSGGGYFTGAGTSMPFFTAIAKHAGGLPTGGGAYRLVFNSDLADMLPRRHSGGTAPDERLVVSKINERFISEEQNTWLTGVAKAAQSRGTEPPPASPEVKVEIANIVSPEMLDAYLATPRGQGAILNVISSRGGSVRKRLR